MGAHVCPWWCAWFSINNPLRRLVHDPEKIVGPYVRPGNERRTACVARKYSPSVSTSTPSLSQRIVNIIRLAFQAAGSNGG